MTFRFAFIRPDGGVDGLSSQPEELARADAARRGLTLVPCPSFVRQASAWRYAGDGEWRPVERTAAPYTWRERRGESYPGWREQIEALVGAVTFLAADPAQRVRPEAGAAFADLDALAAKIAAIKARHPKTSD